jgi:hypothetical protein
VAAYTPGFQKGGYIGQKIGSFGKIKGLGFGGKSTFGSREKRNKQPNEHGMPN